MYAIFSRILFSAVFNPRIVYKSQTSTFPFQYRFEKYKILYRITHVEYVFNDESILCEPRNLGASALQRTIYTCEPDVSRKKRKEILIDQSSDFPSTSVEN